MAQFITTKHPLLSLTTTVFHFLSTHYPHTGPEPEEVFLYLSARLTFSLAFTICF